MIDRTWARQFAIMECTRSRSRWVP